MFEPFEDRVVIVPDKPKDKTDGGILIAPEAQEPEFTGMVLLVGPGKLDKDNKRLPMNVKAGDKVLFFRHAGTKFKLNSDDEYLIMSQSEIMGRFKADEKI